MKRSQSISKQQRPATTQDSRRPVTSSSQLLRGIQGKEILPPISSSSRHLPNLNKEQKTTTQLSKIRHGSAGGSDKLRVPAPSMRKHSRASQKFWDKASYQFQSAEMAKAAKLQEKRKENSLQKQYFEAPRPISIEDSLVKRGVPIQQKEYIPAMSQFVSRYKSRKMNQTIQRQESSSPEEQHTPLEEIPLQTLQPSQEAALPKPFQFLSQVGGKQTSSKAMISPTYHPRGAGDFATFSPTSSKGGLLYNPSQNTVTTYVQQGGERLKEFTIFTGANVDKRTFYPKSASRPMTAKSKVSNKSKRIPSSNAQFRPTSAQSSGAPRFKLISPSGSSVQMEFLKENIHRIQREAESGVMPQDPNIEPIMAENVQPDISVPYFGMPAEPLNVPHERPKKEKNRPGLAVHYPFMRLTEGPISKEQLPFPELLDRSERTLAATFAKFKDLTYYTPVQRIGAYYDFVSRLKRKHLMDIITFLKTSKISAREESTPQEFKENSLFLGLMSMEDADIDPSYLKFGFPIFNPGDSEPETDFSKIWSNVLIKRLETSISRYLQYLHSDAIEERQISRYRKSWMTRALQLVPDTLLKRAHLRALFSEIFDDYSRSQREAILNYILLSPFERQRLHILILPRTFPLTSAQLIAQGGAFNLTQQHVWHQHKREAEEQIKLKLLTNNIAMSSLVSWYHQFRDFRLLRLNGTRSYAKSGYSLTLHQFVELQLAYKEKTVAFLRDIWLRGAYLIIKRFKFLKQRALRPGKWDFTGFHEQSLDAMAEEQSIEKRYQNRKVPLTQVEAGPECLGFDDHLESFLENISDVNELQDIRENTAHISFVAMIGGYIDFNEDGYQILAKEFKRQIKYSGGNLLSHQMRQFVDQSVAIIRSFFLSFPTLQELMEQHPQFKRATLVTTTGVKSYCYDYLQRITKKPEPPKATMIYGGAPIPGVHDEEEQRAMREEQEREMREKEKARRVEVVFPPFYRYQHLVNPIFRLDLSLGSGGAEFYQPLSQIEKMASYWVDEVVCSFNDFPRPQFVKLLYVSGEQLLQELAEEKRQEKLFGRQKRFHNQFQDLVFKEGHRSNTRYFGQCRVKEKEASTKALQQPSSLRSSNKQLYSRSEVKKFQKVARPDEKCYLALKQLVCDVLTVHYNETAAVFQLFQQFREVWSGGLESELHLLLQPPAASPPIQSSSPSLRHQSSKRVLSSPPIPNLGQDSSMLKKSAEQRLASFAELLAKCRRYADKVQLIPESIFFPLFEVNCSGVKRELLDAIAKLESKLLVFLEDEMVEGARRIGSRYKELVEVLQQDTVTAEQVMEMEKFKGKLIQTQIKLGGEAEENNKLMLFLIEEDHILREEAVMLGCKLHHWPGILNQVHDEREELHRVQRLQVESDLRTRRAKLEKEVEVMMEAVKELEGVAQIQHYRKWIDRITEWREQLENLERQAQRVGDQEQMLFAFRSTIDPYEELRLYFLPYSELWMAVQEFLQKKKEWAGSVLHQIKPEDVDVLIKSSIRVMGKLGKVFRKDVGAFRVLQQFKAEITEQNKLLPKIEILCNSNLRERHWKKVLELLGAKFNWKTITLNEITFLNFDNKLELLADISDEANKELALESILEKMKNEWQSLRFKLTTFRDTGIPILQGAAIQDIQMLLDDHLLKAQNMRGSLYIRPFEERVLKWEQTLLTINHMIEEWVAVQTSYLYLEPVFNSQDMKRQMPGEATEFQRIDQMWRDMMQAMALDTLVLHVDRIPHALTRLRRANKSLQRIQRCLHDYLDSKRAVFSRFYFLSNEELLEILGERRKPVKLQTHLKKCFEGVAALKFTENAVTSLISPEGEELTLLVPVYPEKYEGNVEHWLAELELQMKSRVKQLFHQVQADHPEQHSLNRIQWLSRWPAQIILALSQISRTAQVEEALNSYFTPAQSTHAEEEAHNKGRRALHDCLDSVKGSLAGVVSMVRSGKLTPRLQILLGALIVQEVHARDICEMLIEEHVSRVDAFQWQAQLRLYYDRNFDKVYVRMVHTSLLYGYEYLGNTGRLVVTPLTDRCYRTLMGAIALNLGGAPEGPAGTGKTESTKDLAKAVGVQCVIFNCSEGLNALLMGQMFRGLASSGAWSCFDEFNRIELEVLSVIAQQILELQNAKSRRVSRFMFEDKELDLNPSCNIFITMNPGYAGRSNLPDNLKALFRPVAMMVPDYALIAQISLYSFGFQKARELAHKVVVTFRLSEEQLSSQDHYDYGMRSVKAVLNTAAQLKLTSPRVQEEALILEALRDSNLPKFLRQDAILFEGILADLFPETMEAPPPDEQLQSALSLACEKEHVQAVAAFLDKCIQLNQTIKYRHGVMVVGAACGGKTTALNVLSKAHQILKNPVRRYTMNPKAVTLNELYGSYDAISHDWADGILVHIFRRAAYKDEGARWLIFDGPVDTEWVENMNTVLDDTKKLCLSNGQTILMPPLMRLLFQVDNLTQASPATISRCGMVAMHPDFIGWEAIYLSWLSTLTFDLDMIESRIQTQLSVFLAPLFSTVKQQLPTVSLLPLLMALLRLYGGLLRSPHFLQLFKQTRVRQDEVNMHLDMFFLYSALWSFASAPLTRESQQKVVNTLRKLSSEPHHTQQVGGRPFKIERTSLFPDSQRFSAFDFYIDGLRWRPWTQILDKLDYEDRQHMAERSVAPHQIVVPTVESLKYTYNINLLLSMGYAPMLVGGTGTGKTATLQRFLEHLEEQRFVRAILSFSSATKSRSAQSMLEAKLERRSRKQYGPPVGKKLIVVIDDLNLPNPDAYGSQPPVQLLRQVLDHGGWYNQEDASKQFKEIVDVQLLGSMGTAGVTGVTPRFLRHFNMISVPDFAVSTLTRIFSKQMEAFLLSSELTPDIRKLYQQAVVASVELYSHIVQDLRPTPKTLLYMFNLRDLVRVMQGLQLYHHQASAIRNTLESQRKIIRLWVHQCLRVFGDRVVELKDQNQLQRTLFETCRDKIRDDLNVVLRRGGAQHPIEMLSHLKWCDLFEVARHGRAYEEVDITPKELQERLTTYLEEFNSVSKSPMDLVLFEYAVAHMLRISRVLRLSNGHAMLVGIDGTGRRCLTRLAAYIQDTQMYEIEVNAPEDWQEGLVGILRESAVNGKRSILYLTQQQVQGRVANDINSLLNIGEVPGLLSSQDLYSFGEKLRLVAKKEGRGELIGNEAVTTFFKKRIRERLHVILGFSPLGSQLRNTIRAFPSLIHCCTVNFMEGWPDEALQAVADHFIQKQEQKQVAQVAKVMHRSAVALSELYAKEEKRHNYVTPATFLELLLTFKELMERRREELQNQKLGYEKGVEKLQFTANEVTKMQEDLSDKEPKLHQMAKETEELMERVRYEAEEVVEPQQRIIQREEALTNQAFMAAEAMKNECKADLAVAKPMVDAAIAALNTIKPQDIIELKNLLKPPMVIRKVLHAVCVMCQVEPIKTPKPDNPKEFEVNWWETSRRFMGHKDFLAQIINFDKDHIPEHVMGHIRTHFLPDPDFKPSRAKQASLAAKGLCQWVRALDKYDIVAKEVAPKRAKAKESERAAKEAKRNLKQKQEELRQVEEHLERLKGDLDFSARKKRKLELDIAECKLKIVRATQLLDSLGGEQQRWTQISRELEHALDSLLGDVLLSSGMIVYLGVYPSSYREKALGEWASLVREAGIPGSRSFEFSEVLGTAVKKRQWQMNGLPSDGASYESALIMQNSRKWALFIDPQSQGNRWLKREHALSTHFHVARLTDSDLLRTFQNCLQFGLPLLLENVQETIDPRLEGVLAKQVFKQGGALSVKLGDQVIEYNKEFKLYLTTKLPNPHYLPRLSTKITLINLSITESGLADQLLDQIIQRERPNLEEDRNRLIVQNYEHNRLLREAEEKILEILRTTGTNILDNQAAIGVLKESQRIAKETKSKQQAAAITQSHIQEARLLYEPLARYSSILFFTVQLLSRLSPMYLFSLSWYLSLFHRSLQNAPQGEEVEERVQAIQDTLVKVLYSTITRSFFQEHKLLFSFLVALKTSIHKGVIHPSLIFTFSKSWNIHEDQSVPNPFAWLEESLFRRISYLQSIGNTAALSSLIQNIAHNSPNWRSLMARDGAALIENYATEWPVVNSFEETPPLSLFQKLLVIKALAPDRVVQGVQAFVKESLGHYYVQPPIFALEESYAHSAADIPLIFVLPGNDPLASLTHLAQEKRKYDSMKKISLGQGTGPAAQKAIDEAKRLGHWVILQNCHLAPSWMPSLERIVEGLETKAVAAAQESLQHSQHKRQVSADTKSACHPSFRLWLTTYSSQHFPALVLQKGVKIVNEPPAGLKANLLGSYTGSQVINSSDKFDVHPGVMKRLIYSLCVFHALVQERRKYGPLGWNEIYSFTPSDLDISIKQLYNLLETTLSVDTIPWNALIYLTAGCNYGGRVTDERDRALLACFLQNFYSPSALDERAFISGLSEFPYPDQNLTYSQTLKFLRNVIPLDQPASLFGLHPNADIVKEMNSGRTLCDSLFSLRSGFQETKGEQLVRSPYQSEDSPVRDSTQQFIELCEDILSKLSEPFNLEKISAERPLSYENSMNAVLLHEIERYNGLIQVIRNSLSNLRKALLGQVLMTEELDQVRNSLVTSKVPRVWISHSYPSQKTLAAYVNDLKLRLDFFTKWVQEGPPSVFWFSGFFYVQSFLTALLQGHARSNQTSIDSLDFNFSYRTQEPSTTESMYIRSGAQRGMTKIFGLYLQGGSWNYADTRLEEPKHRILIERMPIISLKVMRSELIEEDAHSYRCPVYQTQARRDNKSGPRGHSSNFVREFILPTTSSASHWKKRGVALICQKSQ